MSPSRIAPESNSDGNRILTTASYDYIIIGAGSAGCVMAGRLSEDPEVSVLLVEAGGWDADPLIHVPLGWGRIIQKHLYDWGYNIEPEPELNNRSIECARGRVVGGSSSINAMAYVRGNRADYDRWASYGLDGWSYADLLPYFKKHESWADGEDEFRGGDGPVQVRRSGFSDPLIGACLDAVAQAGLPRTDDYNGAQQEGASILQHTIGSGRRYSTSVAYCRPALGRPNLTVLTKALARKIEFEGRRAVGLTYAHNGRSHRVNATREVILCGGVINSPQLLQLSGVGPRDELDRQGIPMVADVPGVGRNLQDHLWAGVKFRRKTTGPTVKQLRWDRLLASFAEGYLLRTGFCTDVPSGWTAFLKTRPELEAPDIQILFLATTTLAPYFPGQAQTVDGFEFRVVMLRPKSRGKVSLTSTDPDAPARINQNFLSDSDDWRSLRDGLRLMRRIAAQPALADFAAEEISPGADMTTDAQLDAYIRATALTAHHPCGTCKMGAASDEEAVVDTALKVRGIDGLRVIDASVMPDLVGGNINAAVLAIAEKGADLIKADRAKSSRSDHGNAAAEEALAAAC